MLQFLFLLGVWFDEVLHKKAAAGLWRNVIFSTNLLWVVPWFYNILIFRETSLVHYWLNEDGFSPYILVSVCYGLVITSFYHKILIRMTDVILFFIFFHKLATKVSSPMGVLLTPWADDKSLKKNIRKKPWRYCTENSLTSCCCNPKTAQLSQIKTAEE